MGAHQQCLMAQKIAAGDVSYLVHQNFEGTGYDNSESPAEAGTVDPDEATIVGRGSQSLEIVTGASGSIGWTISAASELWGHFLYYIPDAIPTAEQYVWYMTTAGAEVHSIRIRTTGVWRVAHNGVLVNSANAGDLVDATWMRVWWHWKAETSDGAADGVWEVWTSTQAETSRASGTQVISQTNGTGFENITGVQCRAVPANSMSVYYDQVIVSDSEFTSVDA